MIYILSYLLGSIPFGLIFSKLLASKDLRNVGSGNIGATNAFRTGNKIVGILTFVFDTLKGAGAYLMAILWGEDPSLAFIAGLVSILGHIFPIWLKFKGGKGIATTLGVILISHPTIGLFSLIIWAAIAKIFKMSSLAGMMTAAFISIALIFMAPRLEYIGFMIILMIIIYRHKDNIRRIQDKTEMHLNG